jgi:hypothetical protein
MGTPEVNSGFRSNWMNFRNLPLTHLVSHLDV